MLSREHRATAQLSSGNCFGALLLLLSSIYMYMLCYIHIYMYINKYVKRRRERFFSLLLLLAFAGPCVYNQPLYKVPRPLAEAPTYIITY